MTSSAAEHMHLENPKVALAGDDWRTGRYGYATNASLPSQKRVSPLCVSFLREVLREIRNLWHRIREIESRQLDRRGISIDPRREIPLLEGSEIASACCIQDMRSLYSAHPHATLIDVELFVQGWMRGAASASRSWRTQSPA